MGCPALCGWSRDTLGYSSSLDLYYTACIFMLIIEYMYITCTFAYFQTALFSVLYVEKNKNKKLLNISRFLTSRFRQIAFLMTCQQHKNRNNFSFNFSRIFFTNFIFMKIPKNVYLFKCSHILTGFTELTLFHTLTNIPNKNQFYNGEINGILLPKLF